eukprot:6027577-Ditylum_brightwellii.AAC.1
MHGGCGKKPIRSGVLMGCRRNLLVDVDQTLVVKTSTGYMQYLKELDSLRFVDGHKIQWETSPLALPVHAVTTYGSVTYTMSHLLVVDNKVLSSQQQPATFTEYIAQLLF